MGDSLIRVPPYFYIHVLDNNANVTRVETGPLTFTKQDHEVVVLRPTKMVVISSRSYCYIRDPIIRGKDGEPAVDAHGSVMLRYGDKEIRFAEEYPEPFPLYPGEGLVGTVKQLPLVIANTALHLKAERDFIDENNVKHVAGDEWLFKGPATYRPHVAVKILNTKTATIIGIDEALKLRASQAFTDRNGVFRPAGSEWLVRQTGTFMPDVEEKMVDKMTPYVLDSTRALHLCATKSFTDAYGIGRKAGQEWLVTLSMSESHLQNVGERVVGTVSLTILSKREYCVILDPVGVNGKNRHGTKELRRGPLSFFLQPGETLEGGRLKNVYVLSENESLKIRCVEAFSETIEKDGVKTEVKRQPGDLWKIRGPCEYVPTVDLDVVAKMKSIPLDKNEGIYVRNTKTGEVRTVKGETYMLEPYEELWEKDLPREVESLLSWSYYRGLNKEQQYERSSRDKTRAVVFRVPHNAAVQVYDYKIKKARVLFGPGVVMLNPDEQFTVLSISGGKPKRPHRIKSLALMLGPDFMTDVIEVETSDHARLRLQLSYNWHFAVDRQNGQKLFQIRDFVGDACKAIASRVRGAVASVNFDKFHKNSATLIRTSVFGIDENKRINNTFYFPANGLTITNIDIQSVEPVDDRTRDSLQKSVQLAIDITTNRQERNARHDAEEIEQKAKGLIESQKITTETETEVLKQELMILQAKSLETIEKGTSTAKALAKAEFAEIEVKCDVEQAILIAQAEKIAVEAEVEEVSKRQQAEVEFDRQMAMLAIEKEKKLSDIEAQKFAALVDAITPNTIQAIARSGPEMQARLLKGLGLKGYLLTDGNSPVNLFNSAKSMIGQS